MLKNGCAMDVGHLKLMWTKPGQTLDKPWTKLGQALDKTWTKLGQNVDKT
jgi:hypothetical protein